MTKDINQLTDSNKNDLDFSSLSSWIEKIDEKITLSVESNTETLSNISKYLHSLGGKKIRPILTSLSAKLFGMNTPTKELITVAAGIEMIHMATLLHDDIIDQSELRRKKNTEYKKFGLNSTLHADEFLIVRAFGR